MARISRRAFVGGLAAPLLFRGSARAQGADAARAGEIVLAQGYGFANPATGVRVSPEHQFRIASLSKPFTAATVFALIEKRKLRLADRVFGANGILGFDYGRQPYGRFIEDITIEHLLTHTAGGWRNDNTDPMFRNPQMNHAQLIAWTLDNMPLKNPPGTAYAYSNFGYCLLGRVIEKATHQFYPTMVRDNVFHGCGITDMRIAGNTLALRAPQEVVYGGPDGDPYGMNVTRMDSHGGWVATAGDVAKFLMAVGGSAASQLLRPETVVVMTTPRTNPGYAKGWSINGRNWWHSGSLPGTSAVMVRTPNLVWCALANGRNSRTESVGALDRMMWNVVKAVGLI
jgi:CubicO group peptidase (beta-lactamase class C family)